jgi:uncharacterized protein (DUF2236 family)
MHEVEEVSRAELEQCLGELRREIRDPLAGIYGPGTLAWRFNREVVNFLGGGRAALLQLAHPPVARAIEEHSVTLSDSMGRFERTFANIFAMTFGDLDQAERAARRVHNIHRRVRGVIAEPGGRWQRGDPYAANEPSSLLWVHATLIDTVLAVQARVGRPMSWGLCERYYRETRRFARLFGLDGERLPASYREFCAYFNRCLEDGTVAVSQAAREIAAGLLRAPVPALEPLAMSYRALTAGLLPAPVREGYGLPWRRREQALAAALVAAAGGLLHAPAPLRYLPGYLDAEARVGERWGAARLLDRAAARAIPFWPRVA